jgi:hypothetical protein
MSNPAIPQIVLSDALRRAIGGRDVAAAVFLTFQFDPAFFEEEILANLFDQSFSHMPKVRIAQLEELLPRVKVAVYYDRNSLQEGSGPARLDYRRIAMSRSTGYFHAKNVFLLMEETLQGARQSSLLIATLSANLTAAGWWRNVEAAHFEMVREGEKCGFRRQLLELLGRVRAEEHCQDGHEALENIRRFLRNRVEDGVWQRKSGRLKAQFYCGRENVVDFLSSYVQQGEYNLEVVSPYHDEGAAAATLVRLIETTQPRETRVLLPIERSDAAASCSAEYYRGVAALPGVRWAKISADLGGSTANQQRGEAPRFVHAKLYRFWNRDKALYFLGSVNLTQAAFSAGRAGNFETAVLVEPEPSSRQGWWLEPLQSEEEPRAFAQVAEEAKEIFGQVRGFDLRYDWSERSLEYFWQEADPLPVRIEVSASGVALFAITPVRSGQWCALPSKDADAMRELLVSTSFVQVSCDGQSPFRILIREDGMAEKPSILQTLTAEEILHYWSLLSPEQREEFLALRLLPPQAAVVSIAAPLGRIDSMFSRFAGIFHAFGRLESRIGECLQAGQDNEAVYRLFGEKHDSLCVLVRKVLADEPQDRVNRYMTLLCARQVLGRVRSRYPEFCQANRSRVRRLEELLGKTRTVREKFEFGQTEEREQFLDWYERMFFKEFPVLSEGRPA